MSCWIEVWSYVEDSDVPRWIEIWEMEEPQQQDREATLAVRRFASATHIPTGRDFIAFVADFFRLS